MRCRQDLEKGGANVAKKVRNRSKVKYVLDADIDLDKSVVRDRQGRRITERSSQRIAKTALKNLGRPSLSGRAEISPEIKARVPKALKRKIDSLARQRGVTTSTLIRDALERYIRRA